MAINSKIADPFQVKRLERAIKRPLTELERVGEMPVRVKDENGRVNFTWVKQYNLKDFASR